MPVLTLLQDPIETIHELLRRPARLEEEERA